MARIFVALTMIGNQGALVFQKAISRFAWSRKGRGRPALRACGIDKRW